jgi:hypothetical protein
MSFNDITSRIQQRIDHRVREATIGVFSSVIKMTPVGNPTIWKINSAARAHNEEISQYNYSLRQNPENLTSNGRLRRGLKRNDKKKIKSPDGYVGGRARSNWQCTIGSPAMDEIEGTNYAMTEMAMSMIVPQHAGHKVYLSNNVPYIQKLEYGHSQQAPAGMVRISIDRFEGLMS